MTDHAVTVAAPRSILFEMAERYGMEPGPFEATLRATVIKTQCSREEFAAFLLVAREHKLNPMTREIFAFPAKGGGITPVVSVDGWARIINDHPMFDGMGFVDTMTGDMLTAITCKMHRKDRAHPTEATEYMAECFRQTDTWKQWPRRMLRHKAMIQAARYAFGFAGIYDQDEYERMRAAPRVFAAAPVALSAGFSEPVDENVDPPSPEPYDDDILPDPDDTIPPEGTFDVQLWAKEFGDLLPDYAAVAPLKEDWDAHSAELKAVAPSLWKAINRAVADRALEIERRLK